MPVLFGFYNAQYLLLKLEPHKSHKYTIENVKNIMGPEDKLAIYFPGKDNRQFKEWSAIEASTVYYTNDNIVELNSKGKARRFFSKLDGTHCIVRNSYLKEMRGILKKLGLPMNVVDTSHYRFTTITINDASPATTRP